MRPRRSSAGPPPRPTPSCTAIRSSASSTGPVRPRCSWRRPCVSVSRPSLSPIMTASTAWCASPRRPVSWVCPRCSAPSSPSIVPGLRWAIPTPASTTASPIWWCWPAIRAATPCCRGPSARPSCAGPRGHRCCRWRSWRSSVVPPLPPPIRGTGPSSPAVARGPWPRRSNVPVPPPRSMNSPGWSRPSVATTSVSSSGTTAIPSTRPATTPSPNWPCGSGSIRWPP